MGPAFIRTLGICVGLICTGFAVGFANAIDDRPSPSQRYGSLFLLVLGGLGWWLSGNETGDIIGYFRRHHGGFDLFMRFLPHSRGWRLTCVFLLLFVVLSAVVVDAVRDNQKISATMPKVPLSGEAPDLTIPEGMEITADKVEMIETGMTYNEVVEILGCPPSTQSPVENLGGMTMVHYTWTNPGGMEKGFGFIQFVDGVVMTKYFLPPMTLKQETANDTGLVQ